MIPHLIGAVLTGGESRRFGRDKALEIGPTVVSALRRAGVDPVVAVGGAAGPSLGLPVLDDRYPGEGPLGGVATALTYARVGHVLVVPCDLPLIDASTVRALTADLASIPADEALVATVHERPVHTFVCWPAIWARSAHALMASGERRLRSLLDAGTWHGVALDPARLEDADDPSTLEQLLERHRIADRAETAHRPNGGR